MHMEQELCPISDSFRSQACQACIERSGGLPPCARRWLEMRIQTMRLPDEPGELAKAA